MQKKIFLISIAVIVVLGIAGALFTTTRDTVAISDTPEGQFAQCLEQSGAKFYGAFWCPHCQNQKKMFGKAAKLLPYIECSTADGKGQLQVCIDNKVESYPTWVFADDTRLNGEISPAELSEKTACVLPESLKDIK